MELTPQGIQDNEGRQIDSQKEEESPKPKLQVFSFFPTLKPDFKSIPTKEQTRDFRTFQHFTPVDGPTAPELKSNPQSSDLFVFRPPGSQEHQPSLSLTHSHKQRNRDDEQKSRIGEQNHIFPAFPEDKDETLNFSRFPII